MLCSALCSSSVDLCVNALPTSMSPIYGGCTRMEAIEAVTSALTDQVPCSRGRQAMLPVMIAIAKGSEGHIPGEKIIVRVRATSSAFAWMHTPCF